MLPDGVDDGVQGEPDDYETGAEYRIPVVAFAGITREVIVAARNVQVPTTDGTYKEVERFSVSGYLRGFRDFIARPFASEADLKRAPHLHEAIGVTAFLAEYPHPEPLRMVCRLARKSGDWQIGASGCRCCRDRAALFACLVVSPTVRLVPAG